MRVRTWAVVNSLRKDLSERGTRRNDMWLQGIGIAIVLKILEEGSLVSDISAGLSNLGSDGISVPWTI